MRLAKRMFPLFVPVLLFGSTALSYDTTGYQPFDESSEWNSPLPSDAPIAPFSSDLIAEMKGWGSFDWPRLTSDEWSSGAWAGGADDPEYTVKTKSGCYLPAAMNPVAIPDDAKPTTSDDAEVLILDKVNRKVVRLWDATKTGSKGDYSWSACYGGVYFTGSNGLHGDAKGSDDPRNEGWRGVPGNLKTLTYDEVATGEVDHVLAITIDDTASCFYWPMVGDEGHSGRYGCEGLMLRIKPGVDLQNRGLRAGCLTIARALQGYGAMISDTGGVAFAVELEQLSLESRSEVWSDIGVTKDCMEDKISFDDFQVIAGGYNRPKG